jgi:hypothetical protein
MGEKVNVYTVLVGRPEGKRQLRRPRLRRYDNIKVNLTEIGCSGMDWIHRAQEGTGGGGLL